MNAPRLTVTDEMCRKALKVRWVEDYWFEFFGSDDESEKIARMKPLLRELLEAMFGANPGKDKADS
jgi:hypothetical protein